MVPNMIEKLVIRNFKRFDFAEIELGQRVLFIGPNNAGKTTALQALALWSLGVRRWHEKRSISGAKERAGVPINRKDLVTLPVPVCKALWRDLHVRLGIKGEGKARTQNILIEIGVDGVTKGKAWSCCLEFDYANSESFYVRLKDAEEVPKEALDVRMAFLPPMSGLLSNEVRLDGGAIQVRLGEGRTAEVLRNLCYQLIGEDGTPKESWKAVVDYIARLFGATILPPTYVVERGEISMSYREAGGPELDITSSGRGFQQTLLLIAYLYANPGSVVLLDEPDAHLEFLRQRQIYDILSEVGDSTDSQIVIASHSEVLLNEAAGKDVVIAFIRQPKRMDTRFDQVKKALVSIGFEQYLQAEQNGWILYLEGSTDLAILQAFSRTLGHPASRVLERPFLVPVGNQLSKAQEHFFGLAITKDDLKGIAVLDRQDSPKEAGGKLVVRYWPKREIENYLCMPAILETYASHHADEVSSGPLFKQGLEQEYVSTMQECIRRNTVPRALENPKDRWWDDVKASDDFLDRVFSDYFEKLGQPNKMLKTNYHRLASLVSKEYIDKDVKTILDKILEVAESAGDPAFIPIKKANNGTLKN